MLEFHESDFLAFVHLFLICAVFTFTSGISIFSLAPEAPTNFTYEPNCTFVEIFWQVHMIVCSSFCAINIRNYEKGK